LQVDLLLLELQQFFNDYQWVHFKSVILSLLIATYKATLSDMVFIKEKRAQGKRITEKMPNSFFCNSHERPTKTDNND
jgi:hypothetical protein